MSKHGRIWRFIFVLHLYAFLAMLGLVLSVGGAGLLAWKVPSARRFVHTEVVRYYLRDVAPKLPFTIVDLDVDAKWREFMKGWIRNFSLELQWNEWDLKLSGPIQIAFDHGEGEKHLNATYLPVLDATGPYQKVPPIPLTLAFRAEANFTHLDTLTLHLALPEWKWEAMHVKLQDFSLGVSWAEKTAQVSLAGKFVEFDDPLKAHTFAATDLSVSTTAPLTLSPFRIGPAAQLDLSARNGSTRWNDMRLNLPLSHFPIHAQFAISSGTDDEDTLELRAGTAKSPAFQIHAKLSRGQGQPKALAVEWKTQSVALRELLSGVRGVIPGSTDTLDELQNLSGTLVTRGAATIPLPWTTESLKVLKLDGDLDANGVSFEWPAKYLAVSGLNLHLPVSSLEGINGSFDIRKILYRRFQGALGKTELRLTPKDTQLKNFRIHLGGPAGTSSFPLQIVGLPLTIGNVDGDFSTADWDVGTSLQLSPTEVSSVLRQFCLATEHVPPAQVVADFPKIALTQATIDPEGSLRVNLFKGSLELSGIDITDVNTPVPEVDFDLDLDGVRLDQLGDWAGFGEMDGTLQAHAHDVVFQAWLPTQYEFQFEVKPLKHTKVVFSPEAMKNLARLVASDSIDHLPGIAEWAAFGLPSHLLGGYDIWFVGISLFSHDGHILLEVLDPPDLPISISSDHKQNHYILYANRFTIPLKTSHYPLVVDATTVSNYVYGQAMPRLLKLRQAKKAQEKNKNDKAPMDCAPPTL